DMMLLFGGRLVDPEREAAGNPQATEETPQDWQQALSVRIRCQGPASHRNKQKRRGGDPGSNRSAGRCSCAASEGNAPGGGSADSRAAIPGIKRSRVPGESAEDAAS